LVCESNIANLGNYVVIFTYRQIGGQFTKDIQS
jgi:hypothetical protein